LRRAVPVGIERPGRRTACRACGGGRRARGGVSRRRGQLVDGPRDRRCRFPAPRLRPRRLSEPRRSSDAARWHRQRAVRGRRRADPPRSTSPRVSAGQRPDPTAPHPDERLRFPPPPLLWPAETQAAQPWRPSSVSPRMAALLVPGGPSDEVACCRGRGRAARQSYRWRAPIAMVGRAAGRRSWPWTGALRQARASCCRYWPREQRRMARAWSVAGAIAITAGAASASAASCLPEVSPEAPGRASAGVRAQTRRYAGAGVGKPGAGRARTAAGSCGVERSAGQQV